MRAIFISYRRDDTEGHAGRLFHDLCERFGNDAVFLDVAGIEPGRDFRVAIDQQVASCGVLLAVIGTHWLTATDSEGKRRLDDPFDFVRLETAAALRREIPVIPVLVHEAQMPHPEQLPADLKELAFRNSVSLSHTRWDSDVELLARALGNFVQRPAGNGVAQPRPDPEQASEPVAVPAKPAVRRGPAVKTMVLVTLVLTLAGGGYAMVDRARRQAQAAVDVQRVATAQAEARAVQEAAARVAAEQQARERDEAVAQAKTDAAAAREEAARVTANAERRAGEREAALARQLAANDKILRDKAQAAQAAEAAQAAQAAQAARVAAATAAAARATPTVPSSANASIQITAASCRLLANGVYRLDFAGAARTLGTAFMFTGFDGRRNTQLRAKIALGCGAWPRASNACTHTPNNPPETRWLVQFEVSLSSVPTYVTAGLFRDAAHSTEAKLAEARFPVSCR